MLNFFCTRAFYLLSLPPAYPHLFLPPSIFPPLSLSSSSPHFQHICCSLSVSSLCSVGRQPEVQPGDKVAVLQLGGGHLHSLPCPQVPVQGQLRAPQQVRTSFWFSFIIELKHTVSQQIGLTLSSHSPPPPSAPLLSVTPPPLSVAVGWLRGRWWHAALTHPDHTCPWQECGSVPLKPVGISHLQCCGFYFFFCGHDWQKSFSPVRSFYILLWRMRCFFFFLSCIWDFFSSLPFKSVREHTAMREITLLGSLRVWMRLCEYITPLLRLVLVSPCPADHTHTGTARTTLCTP